MKTLLWVVLLAATLSFASSCTGKQAPQSPQAPKSVAPPATEAAKAPAPESPAAPAAGTPDRNLSAAQAAEIALPAIQSDLTLLRNFIDPTNKNIKVFLTPNFDSENPVANDQGLYVFTITFEDVELEASVSYSRVAVSRKTGELLFNGNWYCNDGFVKRDEFLKCVSAPIVRKFTKPSVPTDRDLNPGEAEDLALWALHDDIKFLKHFIDPSDKDHRIFLEGGPAESDEQPADKGNYEFAVYTESAWSMHASLSAYVMVHRKTGQVLFRGNALCDQAWVSKEKYMACMENPPEDPME